MSSNRLYGRAWSVKLGETMLSELDVRFRIVKTLKREPNTLDLEVYNLAENSRGALVARGTPVEIYAGYQGSTGLVFKGDSRIIDHMSRGPDWVTSIKAGDGELALQFARVAKSFAPGVSVQQIVKEVGAQITADVKGAINTLISNGKAPQAQFSRGFSAFGNAGDVLDQVFRTQGLTWSIQNGKLQVLGVNKAVRQTAFVLSPDTGLLGSPEHSAPTVAKAPAVLKVRSLLQHQIAPGSLVQLDSRAVKGLFIAQKVEHTGDAIGTEWFTDIEAIAVPQ